ncbi:MAG: type I-E CRISPR-associated protein Cas6/Cse3/CasE [Blastocatellales bacterium]|nr:type I-E CRISPR-associated protein Cas6/Cse3/CasE [Blastocatellales bacterium]
MFLSRLILNPRNRAVRRDLADCHNLHRTLLSAFPNSESTAPRNEFGLLYRIETNTRSGRISAIVQSKLEPDWSGLNGYLLDVENNPACKSVGAYYDALHSGQRLVFRLRANPTRKVDTKTRPDGAKSNGKRVDIRGEGNQIAWLERKAEASGFRLLRIRIDADQAAAARQMCDVVPLPDSPPRTFPNLRTRSDDRLFGLRADKNRQGEIKRLTFGTVQFEGVLEVTDAEKFKQTLASGIGSGKAYGFGLLSIAPAARR